ncbi:2-amino-4-hydroxy-6-hydroxymethyldihydropteridine diphosphokinase [[Clostridium] polysaccharolyticum]|uniref:Bifunctional folate synthesis protein n=1 Tax=[Clostridium] polysaccharolyticum TaxID=29364 RepID=A0A1I0F0J3_9FIRM|nr:2-amino-4-hydroxy-6-hydroxymethyldihydropteridine diphosphokinase [[Clostridium] polysaccharolyticum]SET50516.1 dihydroneopterin aldolase / 2-amino-4-hydroxy-6-hydroxymethyldihydropteridine diphosphokinase [[Clostridium] polysaccharolyticum]
MDTIKIENLEVYAHHGVLEEENVLGQKFLLSLELGTDTRKSGKSDELKDSVNYAEVAHFVNTFLQENTFRLIEAAAEHVANELLVRFPIEQVRVEMKKPWAPILLPLETVAVSIERKWKEACLSIGSNMGDKRKNLEQAISMLSKHPKVRVEKVSEFFVTKPYGCVEQDDFLNGAVTIKTLLSPRELLDEIGVIEQKLGRERIIHWGPRTIDLDILLYEEDVIWEMDLKIPHVEMHLRDFVLRPLAEIAPDKKHPLLQKTVYQLFCELSRKE